MEDKKVIQTYVNNFRRHLSRSLKKGVGLKSTAFPSKGEGGVLELKIGANLPNEDEFAEVHESVNDVMRFIPQRLIRENIDSVKFSGTNISMEPDRIIIVKGEDDFALWDDEGALDDVNRIIDSMMKGKKK